CARGTTGWFAYW
nr:immunoglobulin heavy chain junction region [Mus musculus]